MCAPSIDLLASSDTGASSTDDITKDNTPSFTGNYTQVQFNNGNFTFVPAANASLEILRDGIVVANVTTDANGDYTYTSGVLTSDTYQYEVRDPLSSQPLGNLSVVVDTNQPLLVSSFANGQQIVLTFDGDLDGARTPDAADFAVDVAGQPNVVSSVSVSGREVTLTLTNAVQVNEAVTVSYADQTNGDTNVITDLAGNELATVASGSVQNVTGDAAAPLLLAATATGNIVRLEYDETLRVGQPPFANQFTVTVGNAQATITDVRVDGNEVELTLADSVRAGSTVTVSYADPSANNDLNATQDSAGNDAGSLNGSPVSNLTVQPVYSVANAGATAEGGNLLYVISRTGDVSDGAEVTYTVSGTATDGADFISPSGTIFIPAGESTATVTIVTNQDTAVEPNETVVVTLNSVDMGGAIGSTNVATGQITNDDVSPPVGGGGSVPSPTVPTNGADVIIGTSAADTISGGLGNDSLSGGLGADDLNGNQGDDSLNGNQGDDLLHGGQGNDQVYGGMGNDLSFGDRGNDVVYGGMGNDSINGNQGNDLVNGNQGNDTVHGGQGDDEVRGGQDDDMVFGDFGNDQVWGDLGNDTLSGGAGADTFHFAANSGNDVIVDFSRTDGDKLDFGGQTFTVADVGGSAVFSLSGGGTVVLTGMSSASLEPSDFV